MIENSSGKIAENKIILLYIMSQFEIPLTESQLTHFVLDKALMNYFSYRQHMSELVHSQMIEFSSSNKSSYYLMSQRGQRTLEIFKELITHELKNIIDNEVQIKKKQYMHESEIIANYVKIAENEYTVYLMAIEKGTPLLDLRLNVVSAKEAQKICKRWKNNAPECFKKIIDLLT